MSFRWARLWSKAKVCGPWTASISCSCKAMGTWSGMRAQTLVLHPFGPQRLEMNSDPTEVKELRCRAMGILLFSMPLVVKAGPRILLERECKLWYRTTVLFASLTKMMGSFGPACRRQWVSGSLLAWFRVLSGSFWFRVGFWVGFRGLSPYSSGILFHHHFLVPSGSGVSGAYSSGIMFHHHFLDLSGPFWFWVGFWVGFGLVPSGSFWFRVGFRRFGEGSGACRPTFPFIFSRKGVCCIMIFWFRLVLAKVPGLVSLLLFLSFSAKRFCSVTIFVPARVPGLSSIIICRFLLVPHGIPALFSFLVKRKEFCFIMICWFLLVHPGAVLGSGACLPSSLIFLTSGNRRPMNI